MVSQVWSYIVVIFVLFEAGSYFVVQPALEFVEISQVLGLQT